MNCPTECNHVSGYTAPLTRQKAIEAKCKDCSYDPLDDGTWRQQVERCEITDCALWNYRPKSRSKKPSLPDSASVEAHYQTNNDQVMQESHMANILSFEERQERDEEFIRQYVELGGNATAAAKAIGVSASSASTTGNRMKKRLWQEIQIEIKSSIETHVPKALHGLVQLADGADSETVRLNAIKDLLDRGGLKPTEKQEIHQTNNYENMSKEELEAELAPLRDQFLEDHLKNNNLHLITQEEFDQVEAILEHTMAIHVDGQQDH